MITEIKNGSLVHENILSTFSCLVCGSGNISDFNILGKFCEDDLLEHSAFITTEQARTEYLL